MNADPIEIAWTVVAVAGLLLALVEGAKARRDLNYLTHWNYNGRRRIVAKGHYRREILRAIQQAMFTAAGLGAMFRPPPPATNGGVSRMVIVTLLVLASALIVGNSWLDRRDRLRLVEYWRTVDLKHVTTRDSEVAAEKLEGDTQRRADESEAHTQRRHDDLKADPA